jgi:major type 1 subunit fimbrin (pilin)
MKMQITAAALAACLGVFALPQPASAASGGTITINGAVTSASCSVIVNGNASPTITLPTVSASDFSAAGDAEGWTPVNFELSNCTAAPGVTKVVPYFSSTAANSVDATTGYMLNLATTGAATGVEVLMSTNASAAGKVALNQGTGNQGITPLAYSTNPAFNLYVGYISTASTVTAGGVQAQVQYVLSYS